MNGRDAQNNPDARASSNRQKLAEALKLLEKLAALGAAQNFDGELTVGFSIHRGFFQRVKSDLRQFHGDPIAK